MPRSECIVGALVHLGEPADTVSHTILTEQFPAAGEYFVGIGLMTHVKDNLVLRGIIYIMESHYQLHGPKT